MENIYTKSKTELLEILKREILSSGGKIIIQTGHFGAIHSYGSNELIPAIYQDISNIEQRENVKKHPYMGDFPLETFRFGLELEKFSKASGIDAKIAVIVNDWQWVERSESGDKNEFREEFYNSFSFPESYTRELAKIKLMKEEIILPMDTGNKKSSHKFLFSEQKLRSQYKRKYSNSCDLNGNLCAQEYVPFLIGAIKYKAKVVIGFVPKTCKLAINAGSVEVKDKFNGDLKIINIFANGTFSKNFFENIEISII